MKIAFLHYHLKKGGVTTVLMQQVEALQSKAEILILTGQAPESPLPVPVVVLEGLGYDAPDKPREKPSHTASAVLNAIHDRWAGGCDLLHAHNPTLAKNKSLLQILTLLQKRGIRLFLQLHDFAEDGRPHVFYREQYPSNCHYGVINSRDHAALVQSGLHPAGLHMLPNTVNPIPVARPLTGLDPFILYPIRAIRRKNIGEAILLSLFFDPHQQLQITLPPNSAIDFPSYNGWKQFVSAFGLKVQFEAGLRYDFGQLVSSARYVITTSIAEGFGFTYLEPWTAKKLLSGRKLPGICSDFEQQGIRLDHLYTRLAVPIDWIDIGRFLDRWQQCIADACRQYEYRLPETFGQQHQKHMLVDNSIDFALLDESFQKQVIERMVDRPAEKQSLRQLNPSLGALGRLPAPEAIIGHNRRIVEKAYSPHLYQQRLLGVYRQVKQQPVEHHIDKTKLLEQFLVPDNLSLLKWGAYDPSTP